MKRALVLLVLAACSSDPPPPPNCPAAPPPQSAPPPEPPPPPPAAKGVDAIAAQVLAALNARDAKALTAMFNADMKKAVPEDKLEKMTTGLQLQKGKILSSEREPGGDDKNATYRFKAEHGDWNVKLVLDREGKIGGLSLTEPQPEVPVAKSTLAMGLPFKGQWSVFWGGDNPDVNYHIKAPSQRRATDLLVVDAEGKTHKGEGKKNEDYYAYGKDVLAVADGTVVQAVDGISDNDPGVMSPLMAVGNSVIIEHEGKVYSFYAHMKPGTVKVKHGAKVKKGQLLGLCGNSGNTSEPHIHFHLQDGPLIDHSWGIEPYFDNVPVTRDGKTSTVAKYTWLKGDLVGTPEKPTSPKK